MNAQQLRNSILQQAIQGKLVPQDPNDEPASVLLERIRKEKEQLVKEGKLKKKDLITTPVTEEEMPFELPNGWEWVHLGYLIDLLSGQDLTPNRYSTEENGIPYITGASCFVNGQLLLNRWTTSPTSVSHYGDLLITCKGTVGAMAYNEIGDIHIARQIMAISTKWLYLSYIKYFLLFIVPELEKQAHSIIPGISREVIINSVFPLPPLSEQRRIVAKLEELLPLVEQYGKAQDQLDALNADLPRRLRQSILQQAVQGKLVPQDPNDEPASVLLEKAFSVKKKMISEKIIKADKLDTPVSEDEFVFELPNGWSWVRLNNVHVIARGGSPRPIKEYLTNAEDGVNWIKIGDTEKGGKYINSTHEKIKPSGVCHSRMIHKGDFLLTNSMSFGRPYISNVEGCIHDGWLVISPAYGIVFDQDYLYYLLSSPFTFDQFSGKVAGAVVQNLNSDKVATSVFPLPPLSEQHRIVTKVEELLSQIDKLK